MYKLLILALFFPFFAFSDDSNFDLEYVCSSTDQNLVTDKLKGISCALSTRSPRTNTRCERSIADFQNNLIEAEWTQEQLNYIGYYVTKDREPRNRAIIYTRYIKEIQSVPSSRRDFVNLINEIRKEHQLEQLEESSILTTTESCKDIFPFEPEEASDQEEVGENDSTGNGDISNVELICTEEDQNSITENLLNISCGENITNQINRETSNCRNSLQHSQRRLLQRGDWTQQQLNYIGYYVNRNNSDNKKIPYTNYIWDGRAILGFFNSQTLSTDQ